MDERCHDLNDRPYAPGPVIYWMSREQRAYDNWGLLRALERARTTKTPVYVVFALAPSFLGATKRQYSFLLRGLEETERVLRSNGIPLLVRTGDPPDSVASLANEIRAGWVVTDFDPLRPKRAWQDTLAKTLPVRLTEVDGHNVVPCRAASDRREYAARTLRPKINARLPEFLTNIPPLTIHPFPPENFPPPVSFDRLETDFRVDTSVAPVENAIPGYAAGMTRLRDFLANRLDRYPQERNDPNMDALSGLSPYLHFGQIAPQRVAYETAATTSPGRDTFLEELIVRRELADNFCHRTPNYDTTGGWPEWARATLEKHATDPRGHLYSPEALEAAETHDPLWNAAQRDMVVLGRMHGWLRMYWVKKILEWTESPEKALEIAIRLNDRYELDGRDPNGYAGISWGLAGLHDRPWGERAIFGTVRSMTFAGAKRKFDVEAYIGWSSRR